MRRGWRIASAAAAILVAMLALPAPAGAVAPEFLLQIPEEKVKPGEGAGELYNPKAIVGDPVSGHIFVLDQRNARISEFTAWGLFVKAWGWGVANGTAELQTCGPAEPEATPDPSLCRKGLAGEGKGQLGAALLPGGIAMDPAGNLWVGDLENRRVQKFTTAGQFLLMFGAEVNKTKVEEGAPPAQQNVCPVAPADVCQKGAIGSGPSHLNSVFGNYIAYSAVANAIAVGGKDRIQLFNLDGSFKAEIPFEGPELGEFDGQSVISLASDSTGNLYFATDGSEDVHKVSAAGALVAPEEFAAEDPEGVAIDAEGGVYVIDDPFGTGSGLEARVLKFDAAGVKLLPTKAEEETLELFPYVPGDGRLLMAVATTVCAGSESPGNLYIASYLELIEVSKVDAYGTPPVGCEPPPLRPPVIGDQFAVSVGRQEATLKAQINPRFWSDTTYFVEYGTGKCSEGGCERVAPVAGKPKLTSKVVNAPLASAGVLLEGLEPGTTFRYRFVAESDGGGPVYGIDPDGSGPKEATPEEGLEGTFTTFRAATPPPICPNEAVRTGASARLPDCRAYEMVSPLDKEGADAVRLIGMFGRLKELNQSALSGEKLTYSSISAFADPDSAPYISQYIASRGAGGWSTEAISPPRTRRPLDLVRSLNKEFQAFSDDLCHGWFIHNSISTLAPGAVEGYVNLYRRRNCSEPPEYEALSTVKPPNRDPELYSKLRVSGFSEDLAHTFFVAEAKLNKDAPSLGPEELLLYERTDGKLRFVCYLPGGEPSSQPCAVGTPAGFGGNTSESSQHNAISADGSQVFFTTYTGVVGSGQPGQIYVRINSKETIEVSGSISQQPAWFWGASEDGSRALFEIGGELYEFDVASETSQLIAGGVLGPMAVSEDALRVYFASTQALAPGGVAGAANLYLYDTGSDSFDFVMELASPVDFLGTDTRGSAIARVPSIRAARASADGLHVAFASSASPTPGGYDNSDVVSGEPAAEVYLYDAVEEELRCVSCNPTGARPTGEEFVISSSSFWQAARIEGWEHELRAPRVLSQDGGRLFFESHEALVPRDTNGVWDVYQWEEPDKGSCTEADATFSPDAGGCVDLISSGESAKDSQFIDADPDGEDVFIATLGSLVGFDPGLVDVYDARVGGGFPEPVPPPPPCEGEACQSPPPSPEDPTPASSSFEGRGNVKPRKRGARRCAKAKKPKARRSAKARCPGKRKTSSRRAGARR